MYFGIVSLGRSVMRLFGRDRLALSFDRSRQSYFEPVTRQATADALREIF